MLFTEKKMVRFFTTSQLKNKVAFGETYVKKCERGKKIGLLLVLAVSNVLLGLKYFIEIYEMRTLYNRALYCIFPLKAQIFRIKSPVCVHVKAVIFNVKQELQ